jgi:hypothetical protein
MTSFTLCVVIRRLLDFPRPPPPRYDFTCSRCTSGKMTYAIKGKTCDTDSLVPGELLHMEFSFWDIPSHRSFTATLVIIDAKTRQLWIFCTSSKRPCFGGSLLNYVARARHSHASVLVKMALLLVVKNFVPSSGTTPSLV